MIIENNENLELVKRLCGWLDEKGMSEYYLFDILEEMGFIFPLKVSDFTEEADNSFSFLCSSSDENNPISYRIILNADEKSPRIITFANVRGFWKQPMII